MALTAYKTTRQTIVETTRQPARRKPARKGASPAKSVRSDFPTRAKAPAVEAEPDNAFDALFAMDDTAFHSYEEFEGQWLIVCRVPKRAVEVFRLVHDAF